MDKKTYKIVLLGNTSVGKSSIISRKINKTFCEFQEPTIGAAFFTTKVAIDTEEIELQIWDTAGQERYKSLAPMYYRGAHLAIIVYDITNYDSFRSAKQWIRELYKSAPNSLIYLVGNKLDLEQQRQVDYQEVQSYVEQNDLSSIETSAKDATNVEDLFKKIGEKLIKIPIIQIKELKSTKDRTYCLTNMSNNRNSKCC